MLTATLRYASTRDLTALRPAWESLLSRVPTRAFFHRWQWHRAIKDHLLPDVTYHCFYEGDSLVAVFPLREARPEGHGIERALELPSHREIFLGDALIQEGYCTPPIGIGMLTRILAESEVHPVVLRFDRVSSRACLEKALRPGRGRVLHTVTGGSAYLDCTTPDSLNALSKKHLRNTERLRRLAVKVGGPVEHMHMCGPRAATEGLDLFMSVEEAGWKGPSGLGTSVSCVSEAEGFYRAVLAGFGETGDARVDLLSIGGTPAAAQLAIRCRGTWSILKIGFDERFAAFGPGNILMKDAFEGLANNPEVSEVNLVTAPQWAGRWHLPVEPTYRICLYSGSPVGWMLLLGQSARGLAHRLKAKVRGSRR